MIDISVGVKLCFVAQEGEHYHFRAVIVHKIGVGLPWGDTVGVIELPIPMNSTIPGFIWDWLQQIPPIIPEGTQVCYLTAQGIYVVPIDLRLDYSTTPVEGKPNLPRWEITTATMRSWSAEVYCVALEEEANTPFPSPIPDDMQEGEPGITGGRSLYPKSDYFDLIWGEIFGVWIPYSSYPHFLKISGKCLEPFTNASEIPDHILLHPEDWDEASYWNGDYVQVVGASGHMRTFVPYDLACLSGDEIRYISGSWGWRRDRLMWVAQFPARHYSRPSTEGSPSYPSVPMLPAILDGLLGIAGYGGESVQYYDGDIIIDVLMLSIAGLEISIDYPRGGTGT